MAGYTGGNYQPNYGNQPYSGESVPAGQYPCAQDPSDPTHHDPPTYSRPHLVRSISYSDLDIVRQCKDYIKRDLIKDIPRGGTTFFTTAPNFTLTLPPLEDYPIGYKQFVFDKIVDKASQRRLEEDKVLNWCVSATTLVPLLTLSDGNCLLHAASLGMWGFQDRDLTLRKAISTALVYHENNSLYRRWRYSQEVDNKKMNITLEPHQWDEEWKVMVQQATSDVPIGKNLDSLDEFHVFVLANVLRRPIIMYAVPKIRSLQGGGTLQEGSIQGVYLPLLWQPSSCKANPLPLLYSNGHFSALVVIESAQQYKEESFVLPLVDYYGQQLPIKFTLDVATEESTTLVMDYLNPIQIEHHGSAYITSRHIICAKLAVVETPAHFKSLMSRFIDTCLDAYRYQTGSEVGGRSYDMANVGGEGGRDGEGEKAKCINNCGMFGDPQYSYLCSNCYRKSREAEMGNQTGTNDQQYGNQSQAEYRQEPHSGDQGRTNYRNQTGFEGGDQRNQSGTTLGTVKCPKCSEPGYPQFLGMCKRCYENHTGSQQQQQQQQQQREGIYETLPQGAGHPNLPSPPSFPPPRDSNERSQCRKPGCEFYGTKETRYYCSKCFESNMDAILKEVDSGPPPVPANSSSLSQPGQVDRSVNADPSPVPPKCRKCNNYFGSQEYSGLCHSCFMNLTKSGKSVLPPPVLPPPSNQSDLGVSRTYTAPQPQRQSSGYYNPRGSYQQDSKPPAFSTSDEPSHMPPPPRKANPTAPVSSLSSQMAGMDLNSTCFLCRGAEVGASSSYTICVKHAASMSRLIQLKEEGGDSKPEDVGRHRGDVGGDSRRHRDDVGGYRDTGKYGGDMGRHRGDMGGYGGDAGRHRGDVGGYGGDAGRHRDDMGGYGGDAGRHRDDMGGYGGDAGRHRGDVGGYGGDVGRHRGDVGGYGDGGNQYGPDYANQKRSVPPREDHNVHPDQKIPGYSSQQPPREFRSEQGYSSQAPQHRPQQPPTDKPQDYEKPYQPPNLGGAGGGANRGAVGGAGEGAVGGAEKQKPFMKALCATVGCSFKGYKKLYDLCPDCYRDNYPNEISEEEFPLV